MDQPIDTPTFLIVAYFLMAILVAMKLSEEEFKVPAREVIMRSVFWPLRLAFMLLVVIPLVLYLSVWDKITKSKTKRLS